MVNNTKLREFANKYFEHVHSVGIEKHASPKEEGYKFEFVNNFQQKFDLAAPDLANMLEKAIQNCNLVATGRGYLPRRMIIVFARENPDETRAAFKKLFDETLDVRARIDEFRNTFEALMQKRNEAQGKKDITYIGARFTSLLLAARYPEKYYPVKPNEFRKFAAFVDDAFNIPTGASEGDKYVIFAQYADALNTLLRSLPEAATIRDAFTARLQFKDPHFHWVTQDAIFVTAWGDKAAAEEEEEDAAPRSAVVNGRTQKQPETAAHPLNLILYGPPGTGKTYQAIRRARELVEGQEKRESREEATLRVLRDLSWFELLGVVLFLKGRPTTVPELAKDENVQFFSTRIKRGGKSLNPVIWAVLMEHTAPASKTVNVSVRREPYLFDKTAESSWHLTQEGKDLVQQGYAEIIAALKGQKTEEKHWRDYCRFITFHQSYAYEEFVEGIRPVLDSETVRYELRDGIFKEICAAAAADPSNKYVLVIDEINRGNISKIFGELITLLEEDKRDGGENYVPFRLPYSQDEFAVPQNLYIIGTMNTADRSIALLDVALRRRFEFCEIMPEYEETGLNAMNIDSLNVGALLERLNGKLELLVDRDHQIGHSYLMKIGADSDKRVSLHRVWYGSIVPLLQEYFYGDWQKLRQALGDYKPVAKTGFVSLKTEDEIRETLGDEAEDYIDAAVGSVHEYTPEELPGVLAAL